MPVTLDDLAGADAAATLAALRSTAPVAWVGVLDGWLVTSHAVALAVLRDAGRFTVDDPRFSTAQVVGPSMLSLDGPAHARHRAPFAPPFRAARLPELLRAMGAVCTLDDDGLTTTAGDRLYGLDADLSDCTELVPALTALAALAETESHLTGIAHIRGHETDRLRALSAELTALGGECHETPDGLRVVPRRLHGGVVHTYDDHRMAMFGAVLGLAVDGVSVENVATVGKTVPDFVERWTAMVGTAR